MVYAKRTDDNQADILDDIRKVGASAWSLHRVGEGVPDILVGYRGKNYLFEIKNPNGKNRVSERQEQWIEGWRGQAQVVRSSEEIIAIISNER